MPSCSFCRKRGHNIATCRIRLTENVDESEALVAALSTAVHSAQSSTVLDRTALVESLVTATAIAQSKLAKDLKRFAEVESTGKGGDDPEAWVRVDVEEGAAQTPVVPEGATQTPDVPDRLFANKAQQVCACSFDRAACGQCGRGCAQDQSQLHPQD